eukprot:g3927.t1
MCGINASPKPETYMDIDEVCNSLGITEDKFWELAEVDPHQKTDYITPLQVVCLPAQPYAESQSPHAQLGIIPSPEDTFETQKALLQTALLPPTELSAEMSQLLIDLDSNFVTLRTSVLQAEGGPNGGPQLGSGNIAAAALELEFVAAAATEQEAAPAEMAAEAVGAVTAEKKEWTGTGGAEEHETDADAGQPNAAEADPTIKKNDSAATQSRATTATRRFAVPSQLSREVVWCRAMRARFSKGAQPSWLQRSPEKQHETVPPQIQLKVRPRTLRAFGKGAISAFTRKPHMPSQKPRTRTKSNHPPVAAVKSNKFIFPHTSEPSIGAGMRRRDDGAGAMTAWKQSKAAKKDSPPASELFAKAPRRVRKGKVRRAPTHHCCKADPVSSWIKRMMRERPTARETPTGNENSIRVRLRHQPRSYS